MMLKVILFPVSDVTISNVLSITEKAVKPTKEKLRKSGLIQYENKIGFPCSYRLSLNYPLEIPESKKIQNPSQISNSKENEIQVQDYCRKFRII